MNMQESVLYIILILLCVVIYILVIQRKNKLEGKNNQELNQLKDSLTGSINTMSSSFNALSKDVTRDMTQALTKVDEKVSVFNRQVEAINKSQDSFSRILAGVKQYGGLAEFSLASLLKDLLPAAQYIANVKMKPDDTRDVVEFAVKLENMSAEINWKLNMDDEQRQSVENFPLNLGMGCAYQFPGIKLYFQQDIISVVKGESFYRTRVGSEMNVGPIIIYVGSFQNRGELIGGDNNYKDLVFTGGFGLDMRDRWGLPLQINYGFDTGKAGEGLGHMFTLDFRIDGTD